MAGWVVRDGKRMLMRWIERLTGRTRRTTVARNLAAALPVEQRAARIEAQIQADIERRELNIRAQWSEVQALAGKVPSVQPVPQPQYHAHEAKGPNTEP